MPDIKSKVSEIGGAPTSKNADGTENYTVPVISDPNTGRVVSDSLEIAKYLDETYPTPRLFSGSGQGSVEDQAAFIQKGRGVLTMVFVPLVALPALTTQSERGQAYYRPKREAQIGKKLEELAPPERRAALLEAVHEGLATDFLVERCVTVADGITYKDVVIAAALTMMQVLAPPGEYDAIVQHGDGKWMTFMQHFEKYQSVSYIRMDN